jgi:hypothetical protein
VTQVMCVTIVIYVPHVANLIVMCHCMDIYCVIGGLLVTDFNKVWEDEKVKSGPSADYFELGRRRKGRKGLSLYPELVICGYSDSDPNPAWQSGAKLWKV